LGALGTKEDIKIVGICMHLRNSSELFHECHLNFIHASVVYCGVIYCRIEYMTPMGSNSGNNKLNFK
jgi:hypothetical protein